MEIYGVIFFEKSMMNILENLKKSLNMLTMKNFAT